MIKAIIFDCGGVIKSSHKYEGEIALAYEISSEAVAEAIKPLMEDFWKGLISENNFWKKLSTCLKKPVPENKNILWRKSYKETFFVYQEMIEFIKRIKKQKIKTAILSNIAIPHLEIIKNNIDLANFDTVIFSCEVGLAKPDSKIYLLVTQKLDEKPQECIFVDDLEENLMPAEKLGMKTILAKNPQQVIKDVSAILKEEKIGHAQKKKS